MTRLMLAVLLGFGSALAASTQVQFQPEGPTLLTHSKSAFENVVRSIAVYRGDVWWGTYGRGLFKLSEGKVESFTAASSPLLEDRVNCLAVVKDELWAGTCAGVNVTDGRSWRSIGTKDGLSHHIYHVIKPDTAGRVWVGTTGKGLCVLEAGRWATLTAADGLAGDWVNDVLELPGGEIWAASLGGLSRRDASGKWSVASHDGFPIYKNAVALAALDGALWAGFGDAGLFTRESGTWYRPPPELLASPAVHGLAVDGRQRLWIATERGATALDREGTWESVVASAGLRDRDLRALVYDAGRKELLAGTAGGEVYSRADGAASWTLIADKNSGTRTKGGAR